MEHPLTLSATVLTHHRSRHPATRSEHRGRSPQFGSNSLPGTAPMPLIPARDAPNPPAVYAPIDIDGAPLLSPGAHRLPTKYPGGMRACFLVDENLEIAEWRIVPVHEVDEALADLESRAWEGRGLRLVSASRVSSLSPAAQCVELGFRREVDRQRENGSQAG